MSFFGVFASHQPASLQLSNDTFDRVSYTYIIYVHRETEREGKIGRETERHYWALQA